MLIFIGTPILSLLLSMCKFATLIRPTDFTLQIRPRPPQIRRTLPLRPLGVLGPRVIMLVL